MLRLFLLPILTTILLFPMNTIHAQYEPMVVENTHWIVTYWDAPFLSPNSKFSWTIREDTLINNLDYKMVFQENFLFDQTSLSWPIPYEIVSTNLIAYIREDINEKKVYCIQPFEFLPTCPVNEEFLLYNFSHDQDDMLDWCVLDFWYSDTYNNSDFFVDSIAYHNLADATIYTTGVFGTYGLLSQHSQAIIPGFGFENFGLFLLNPLGEISIDVVKCIGENIDCNITTSTNNPFNNEINIYPNPVSNMLFLDCPATVNASKITIVDLNGKLYNITTKQSQSKQIDISHLPDGIYFLKIKGKTKQHVFKFIKSEEH